MTTRKSSAGLALLLSILIALAPVVFADDTELFTTSATPNVLLMLDSTGSMDTAAGGADVGNLDGSSPSNSRMDILWKVIYTLLNSDLSIPQATATYTCSTSKKYRAGNTSSTIQVNGTNWNRFPASATIQVGAGGQSETFTYSSKSISSNGNYLLNFSPSITFGVTHNSGSVVSYSSGTSIYNQPFPLDHTQATSTDFSNNLTPTDEETLKARIGLMTFSSGSPGSGSSGYGQIWSQIQPDDNNAPPFDTSYRSLWSTTTQKASANGGTPTARALRTAQSFFDIATSNNTVDVCRPNFAVMVTDGEDTLGGSPSGGSGSGGGPDYYSGSGTSGTFYPDGNPGTSNNRGQVARNNAVIQEAWNLKSHSPSIQLFTVGVGISDDVPHLRVMREVLRRAAEQNDARADVGASNPNTGVYHDIGVNGDNTSRALGRSFFASDATELSTAMRNIFQQITAGTYSFTAPTVASVRMTDRNYLYKATFVPAAPPATFWEGHLEALSINDNGALSARVWDAAEKLKTRVSNNTARNVYAGYTADNVTWSLQAFNTGNGLIDHNLLGVDNTAVRNSVVDYVLGAKNDNNYVLGDIFHSKPVVVGPPSRFFFDEGYSTTGGFADINQHRKRVIYVGTNDGMLHAFLGGVFDTVLGQYVDNSACTNCGEELFGYIPYNLLDNLGNFLRGELTTHGYYVDSSPRVADIWLDEPRSSMSGGNGIKDSSEWKTVLIGGVRKGGNGYFALDVTNPDNPPGVLWEYTNPGAVGQTWSEPFIGKVRVTGPWTTNPVRDRWVAIFGGGNSDAGTLGAALVVLDIATGRALKTFTTVSTPSGSTTPIDNLIVASPTAVLDANGYIKFVYANDLDGSLYKFDFRRTGTDNTYAEWKGFKIFEPPAGGQPVFHRVESGSLTESTRYLFFGTGNQENPVSDGRTGRFYGIKDADTDNTTLTVSNLGNLSTSIISTAGGTAGAYGWYIDFGQVTSASGDNNSHSGEKVLSDPVVFFNQVFFTTYTPDLYNPCGGGGIARVYGLQMLNAGAGLASLTSMGEAANTKVPYHVYTGSLGGIPSSPSLSIYPSGQSSIFVGFSTGRVEEIKIESPTQMKTIKSWKEMF